MTDAGVKEPPYDNWADFYDITDTDRAPFIGFYRRLVTGRTRSLLELGCGTGTITTAMARELARAQLPGARVVGVDESPRMLDVARRRGETIEWVLGDIRALPVSGPFDLIISCFNTLQHLLTDEDLALAFGEARRVIADDGFFAFDIYHPNAGYLSRRHRDHLARMVSTADGRQLEIREDTDYDRDSRVITIDWRLVEKRSCSPRLLTTTRYRMRQYFPDEIERLLTAAGLAVRERFGDFDLSPFTPASKRQVVVCAAI